MNVNVLVKDIEDSSNVVFQEGVAYVSEKSANSNTESDLKRQNSDGNMKEHIGKLDNYLVELQKQTGNKCRVMLEQNSQTTSFRVF